jgi:hypothetical protein
MNDGRYEGGNGNFSVVLRVDTSVCAVVSGDIYQGDAYLASVRTAPSVRVDQFEGRWPAIWQDSLGATATGEVALTGGAERADALSVTLRADQPVNGLPVNGDVEVVVEFVAAGLRQIGVETEVEAGIRLPQPVDFHGTPLTFRECLRSAGFEVRDVGATTEIPRPATPWDYSKIFSLLDDLMASTARAGLSEAAWELHLLLLSATTNPTLLGIMFDMTKVLPRQGAAVFIDEIRRVVSPDLDEDRKIVQTIVHELGHGLNLAHRFERVVGHAESTSFMNYDWRYRGGGHEQDFWNNFSFSFDPDELEFLRHAPRDVLMPGRAAFHSVSYWRDYKSFAQTAPVVPWPGLRLTLTPPEAGPVFAFGAPVFLQVNLHNDTAAPVVFPSNLLDPKAGWLEILIRRSVGIDSGAGPSSLADAVPFVPIVVACELERPDAAAAAAVGVGTAMANNLNLTFGSGGFSFAEPGTYDVIPLVGFTTRAGDLPVAEIVIQGQPLRIRIGYPRDAGEEADALVLTRPDVGTWFALGGTDSLGSAREALARVRERRQAERGMQDPVVSAIVRTEGINAGRDFIRFRNGEFRRRSADPGRAAELLTSLDAAALRNFDPHTAAATVMLANGFAAEAGGA